MDENYNDAIGNSLSYESKRFESDGMMTNNLPKLDPQMVGAHERGELLKSHMKRPRVSIRKLGLYVRWLNSLRVWSSPVEIGSLGQDMCNGLLLCNLMKKLVPNSEYKGLNKKPLTQKPAVANLELALSVIWRSGRVNNTRIPSALSLYEGKHSPALLRQMLIDFLRSFYIPLLREGCFVVSSWILSVLSLDVSLIFF